MLEKRNETWWNVTVCSSAAGNSAVSWVMQCSFLLHFRHGHPAVSVWRRRWCCSVTAHSVSFYSWTSPPRYQRHLWTIREWSRSAPYHPWPWQCPRARRQICAEMSTSESKQICTGPLTSPWFVEHLECRATVLESSLVSARRKTAESLCLLKVLVCF